MLAHTHGQLLNSSKFGTALGVSHTTVRSYLDLLTQTYMVRTLEPLVANVKKRVVKSPKVYVRDSGILHALVEIRDERVLVGHPIYGSSWEGFVVENIIASLPDWQPNFYRTTNGAEIVLVLSRGRTRIGVECKAATAPTLGRGMRRALQDHAIDEAWIVSPVTEPYPVSQTCTVSPLAHFLQHQANRS